MLVEREAATHAKLVGAASGARELHAFAWQHPAPYLRRSQRRGHRLAQTDCGTAVSCLVAGLTRTGLLDLTAVHDRYALRATIYWAVEYGLDEFKRR